ncbi:uncharacterized protein LOC111599131 [Drosophila hydei]|uniref:Uncharacterized protein LOC111599131 n=1 Tax=Drosophila hydei TaxID=7224 RepID=A0A6J1LVE5_DROHY|nr:uncharacterized protein LOC111599131 [Drosophila hydei]
MSNKSMACSSSSCSMLLLLLLLLPAMPNAAAAKAARRARITASSNNNSLNEPLTETQRATTAAATKLKTSTDSSNNADSKYEIRGVAGEPNYKSVNLTWEVEFVTPAHDTDTHTNANTNTNTNTNTITNPNGIVNANGVTNMSGIVEPPKAFQIFYCEMQNYGPQRCRVKLVNATAAELPTSSEESVDAQVQHFGAAVDNLRMATRYSFHIRPVQPRRLRSSSGRSEFHGENEIEGASAAVAHLPGQSIIIPTKGFSAHATQCLAHASEIEVETGPYFGGRIVVDGGDCGIKGNANDPADKYTMRIDHKQCGSMVKPETNTVETFITVQENLGIFTHSTRRFVVVCSYQSGMQTVRASFTVPGKNAGVAAAIEPNDPFQPDDERLGRELRHMRFVNKSELVLKESEQESVEQPALVIETQPPEPQQQQQQQHRLQGRALSLASLNELNNLAKSPDAEQLLVSKYAKLVEERANADANDVDAKADDDDDEYYAASLRYISANLGSVLVTVSISVIIISICLVLLQRQRFGNGNKSHSHLASFGCPVAHLPHKTLPRALQQQYQCTL